MFDLYENDSRLRQFGSSARKTTVEEFNQSDYIDRLSDIINSAQVPAKKESKLSVWKTRFIIFLVFFLIAEVVLRVIGFKPGVIDNFYYHRGELVYDSILYGDEFGITHATRDAQVITGAEINSEGFFSSVEFTPESIEAIKDSGQKVVMLIGDSYTQGCCADHFNASFAQLLNNQDDFVVLNFGIPGADPVQYRLIVEKYAQILHPDLIVLAVYGGNDILEYDRTAKPYVPLSYPIKGGPWLNSEGPIYLTKQGTYFKSFDEAKSHYFEYFSLWGEESSIFEKKIRNSIILSKPYLIWKRNKRNAQIRHQMPESLERMPYSFQNLDSLKSTANSQGIPVLFSLIPSPSDVESQVDLEVKYGFVFNEIEYFSPDNLKVSDYDGLSDANHFNNQGHQKFADFLRTLIESRIED